MKKILIALLTSITFLEAAGDPSLTGRASPEASRRGAAETGVLLLAHGGSRQWDLAIAQVQKDLTKNGYATEIALGMAVPANIEKAIKKLETKKVKKIVAVPLLIGSHSELYEQFEYVLGKRLEPSSAFLEGMSGASRNVAAGAKHHSHHKMDSRQVTTKLPLHFSPAFDDHPYVAQILLARAKALSRDPSKEVLVLISHGPYTDEAEKIWMEVENRLAKELQTSGGFAEVKAFNLRDDSPKPVQEARSKEIRTYVQSRSKERKNIIIVPHLVAMNGIEKHITKALEGLFYKMSKEALLPHPLISEWALAQIRNAKE